MRVIDATAITKRQADEATDPSGLACLVIVARHHGIDLSVSQLVHDNVLATRQVSVADLVKCPIE